MAAAAGDAGRDPAQAPWPKGATWPLLVLTLISVFNYLDRSLLGLALPMIKREFAASDTELGLVSGLAFIFLYSFLGIPIAWLADRANRRNIIAIGLSFWSLMTVLTGYVGAIWQLAIARFLMGAGEACGIPPSNSIIADLFPPQRRPLAMAIFGTANSIAFIAFFPLAGWIAQHHGWRAMFIAMGVPGMLVAILFMLTVKEPLRAATAKAPRAMQPISAIMSEIGSLFSNKCFLWLFLGSTLMGANVWASGAWTPSFFTRVHHMTLAEVAGITGPVRGVVGATGVLLGGLLLDRLPLRHLSLRITLPAVACILVGPAEAMFLLGERYQVWLPAFIVASLLTLIHQAPVYAATANIIGSQRRALAIAVLVFGAGFIGNAVGPAAVGVLNDALSASLGENAIRYSMLIIAVTPILAGLCLLRAATYYREMASSLAT
ncbi:MAG: MFS transporter [Sphingobium sp.]|nr:MFS transporter [Sphingobium sp.]